jgi:hypothetical protein
MKKAFLIAMSLALFNLHFLNAQENSSKVESGKIGLTFASFGENNVVRFTRLDGDAGYDSDYFYTFGITYVHPVNHWLEGEAGLEYARHGIVIQPNVPPDMDNTPLNKHFALINIPLTLRANFFNYFFVNGGLFVGIDGLNNTAIDSQTGIGVMLGVSIKYDFDFGVSAFINPYAKMHSLIPFTAEKYHQRIMENGIRIGITYALGKAK